MMRLKGLVILLFWKPGASAQQSSIHLHELYEPAPVDFRFETPGWLIMAGIILTLTILLVIWQVRKYIKNRYRREALKELEKLDNTVELFPHLFVVLKQTAILRFGREKVGHLYGLKWLSFLEKTGKNVRMTDYHEQIQKDVYAGKEMGQDIRKAVLLNAKKWVRTHAGQL